MRGTRGACAERTAHARCALVLTTCERSDCQEGSKGRENSKDWEGSKDREGLSEGGGGWPLANGQGVEPGLGERRHLGSKPAEMLSTC